MPDSKVGDMNSVPIRNICKTPSVKGSVKGSEKSSISHVKAVKFAEQETFFEEEVQKKLEYKDELTQAHLAKVVEIIHRTTKRDDKQEELEDLGDGQEAKKANLIVEIKMLTRDIENKKKIQECNKGIFESLIARVDGEIACIRKRAEEARVKFKAEQDLEQDLSEGHRDDGADDVAKWVAEAAKIEAIKKEEDKRLADELKAQELLVEEQKQLEEIKEKFRQQREKAGIPTVIDAGTDATQTASGAIPNTYGAIPKTSGVIPKTGFDVGAVPYFPLSHQFLGPQSQSKDLPFFNGNPDEWLSFKGAYDRTNLLYGFSLDQNLGRLQRCLQGAALRSVRSMFVTPLNVPQIMERLEMRFGQPDYIISSVMKKLRETPALKPDNFNSIVEFSYAVDDLMYTLKALNRPECLQNSILIQELESKVPNGWRMEYRSWLQQEGCLSDLSTFAKWMEQKARIASALCPPNNSSQPEWKERQEFGRNRNRRPVEKVFVAGDTGEKTKVSCVCCGIQGRRIQDCPEFKKKPIKDRQQIVKEKRLCFNCLYGNHGVADCKNKSRCKQEGCGKKHHSLLHEVRKPAPKKEDDQPPDVALTATEIIAKTTRTSGSGKKRTIYKFVEATFLGPNDEEVVGFIVRDDCSAWTILDNQASNELNLERKKKPFSFGGLGYTGKRPNSDVVELRIRSHHNNEVYTLKNVQTDDVNYLPRRSLSEEDVQKWEHLRNLPLKFYDNATPKLLLGIEHGDLMETIQRTDGRDGAPIACETKLGWTLTGTLPPTLECPRNEAVLFLQDDEDLHQLVKNHFTTEDFGVKVVAEKPRSEADKRALAIMDSTARKVGNQWEIGLLWKDDEVCLPESRRSAFQRLKGIEKKMDQDPSFAKLYVEKIQENIDKGYVRKLSPEEIPTEDPKLWYDPHFGVTNPNKPGKFRLVNDAAAKSHGTSLNDNLLTGPDFVPPLTAVLYRFRERAIGFTGDICEMFHQVKIRQEDLAAQRFLWRGMDRNREPDEYVFQVMVFGAACSPSCAQYIKNRNADEFASIYPEAVKDVKKNHYVDDYLACADTVDEAIERQQQVQEIHRKGGFKICKWISNSKEFNARIPEDLRAEGTKSMDMDSIAFSERVLGMHWEPGTDNFTFKTDFLKVDKDVVQGKRIPTKREALGLTMSVFDQFGFVAHFSIKAKMTLQMAWRSKVGWDEELPPALHDSWLNWIDELAGITNFKVPRCYSLNLFKAETVQLHIFTDGSEDAFSAMGYFRVEYNGEVEAFVTAKAKVAPLKPISIPRMELQGAVMGSRLARTIEDEHTVKITERIFWCDSATVLKWISSDGRNFKTFVAHRIGELQEGTEISEWRWIPTKENVADEATRNNKPCDWSPTSRWLNGPAFLKKSRNEWPVERGKLVADAIDLQHFELKKDFLGLTLEAKYKCLLDIEKYSSYVKMIRSTVMFLMAVENFKKKRDDIKVTRVTADELEKANRFWWKRSQMESYPDEYRCLKKNGSVSANSPLVGLTPFLDEQGIMRMKGRIPENAEIFALERNPVILHPKHAYTVLLIKIYHQKADHHGMERVVNDLRQKFVIPTLRVAVKRTWTNCQLCKIRRAMPRPPMMGELPLARLQSFVHPFTISGVDYFGPMEASVGYKRREKRYGALFTCMSTRAIHVELVASLSTDSCIMAIRRFISRRGNPRDLFSDNGTNFVGANNEIKRALEDLDQDKMTSEMANRGINWHFIPPAAPHMGGAWERKVKSFKVAMAATLHQKAPKEEVLLTLMAEAENTVNGHPLTHVPCDPDDLEALTPNHFLIGRSNNLMSWRKPDDEEKCIRKLWEQAQQLADLFWRRWVREYLPTLTKRDKWFQQQKPIEVGDVVIMVDNTQPRNCWPKGRIVEVYPGKDGQVRTVLVKTASGTYKRPAVKVCVLDVKGNADEGSDEIKPEDCPEMVLLLSKLCSRQK